MYPFAAVDFLNSVLCPDQFWKILLAFAVEHQDRCCNVGFLVVSCATELFERSTCLVVNASFVIQIIIRSPNATVECVCDEDVNPDCGFPARR